MKFNRPSSAWRFKFSGLKTNAQPDSLGDYKYNLAINVRATDDDSLTTRPGLTQLFQTLGLSGGVAITDIRAYTTLNSDNKPRFLARDKNGHIWLDNGNFAGLGTIGVSPDGALGAAMLPFRPAESPNPYMYIANGVATANNSGYQKFSAPSSLNVVTQQNVGIAEPQTPPEAAVNDVRASVTTKTAGDYTAAGTAGSLADATRVSDTAGVVFPDPAGGLLRPWSVQVSSAKAYQRYQLIQIGSGNIFLVEDVLPPLPSGISIFSIFYYSGTTGRCVIVPNNVPGDPAGSSIFSGNVLNNLRRGSLIQIGSEICYVRSVATGPTGTVAIETSTVSNHTTADTITGIPAINVFSISGATFPSAAAAIIASSVNAAVTTGVGTLTATVNLFSGLASSFQPNDFFCMGLFVDNPNNLSELKILIDVGDGTFTKNYYYYAVRPSDIQTAVANTSTQLAAAQLVAQRAIIDDTTADASNNQLQSASSAQMPPGASQWLQLAIPLNEFTRVGSDLTVSLLNMNKLQFSYSTVGTVNVSLDWKPFLFGQFQPDTGPDGAPYQYRVRPRSSVTGVKGNPSPATRYGITTRRHEVFITLPSAAYDSQIDTWDVFRYGGTVFSWRKIGQSPSSSTIFFDNYSDIAASAGEQLELDNLEPWPSIDLPMNATATQVTGTAVLVTVPAPTNATRYLPGNTVVIGGNNAYTLRSRPVNVSGNTYLFELNENAGAGTNLAFNIYEPLLARQPLPYMWGPDATGTIFAVGDYLRSGSFSYCKPNNPDSAPDRFNQELVSPSEPLLGGEILDGLSFVASSKRWWALYPQLQDPLQRYNPVQQPVPRGLAAPYGKCSDGKAIYFWAEDGIWATDKGSLTDADLYNIFPHDGVAGQEYVYAGNFLLPPDYSQAGRFRLAKEGNYLYALYVATTDLGNRYFLLVYDLIHNSWSVDSSVDPITGIYAVEQPSGSLGNTLQFTPTNYPKLVFGTNSGKVAKQDAAANDLGQPISCVVATAEWPAGDIRSNNVWGDMILDCLSASANGLVATIVTLGVAQSAPLTVPLSTFRKQQVLSLGGGILQNFVGLMVTWSDNFPAQNQSTSLYIWQPSYLDKPENIIDRFTDWEDGGDAGAKWVQGFILQADTFNNVKSIVVRDSDTQNAHSFSPLVQHNGESMIAYSFDTPFIAHQMRLEPANDGVLWRYFDCKYIFEPTPETAETWQTQGFSFGLNGFKHMRRVLPAYAAQAPVTLTISSFDGTSPVSITLPSTGGAYQKISRILTFNKGMLYFFKMTSSAPFQVYAKDFEAEVGEWGRPSSYSTYRIGADHGAAATI